MNAAEMQETLDLAELEHLLTGDIVCEHTHRTDLLGDCTVNVTHITNFCAGSRLACSNAAAYYKRRIEGSNLCSVCKHPTASCWSVRPI
jgi:hypothetical protein